MAAEDWLSLAPSILLLAGGVALFIATWFPAIVRFASGWSITILASAGVLHFLRSTTVSVGESVRPDIEWIGTWFLLSLGAILIPMVASAPRSLRCGALGCVVLS